MQIESVGWFGKLFEFTRRTGAHAPAGPEDGTPEEGVPEAF
jgi:hypothetical protein